MFTFFRYFLPVLLYSVVILNAAAQEQNEDLDLDKPKAESLAKDSSTEINVRNADIASIVRVFSKKTKRNYILDERVKGKVSIYLPGKVSSQDSIRILDSVLAYKGFAAVPIGENLWKVIPAKEARQSTVPTVDGEEIGNSASVVTRLVNLKNVSADEAKQVLQQLISPDGFINSYAATNSLILIDSEDNIARLMGILDSIDVAASSRDMTIIPIENADAKDIADKLKELLTSEEKKAESDLLNRNSFRAPPPQAGGNPAAVNAADQGGNPLAGPQANARQPKIIADERTNSVIVVADETSTARIQALIEQLDSPVDLSGLKFYVYHCQHAKAEELADVLAGLVGEGSGSSGGSSNKSVRSGTAGADGDLLNTSGDSLSGRQQNRNRTQNRLNSQTRTPGQSRNQGNQQSAGVKSVQLGENFSISADSATNTLIIFANKSQFEKVKALLETLDVKRRQVLVEATLLEVGIDENEKLKSSFIFSGGGKDGGVIAQSFGSDILGMLANPSGIEDFSIAAASAGTLTIGGGDNQIVIPSQTALLSAVQKNTNVNILSAPNILATNNEPAEIVVGRNIPFITSTSTDTTNLSNTFNQIDRQDVGITLRLTPQISSRDTVTLSIFTEVSSLISTDPALGPTTAVRTTETSVIAKDGQMIVTGGLMSDENTNTDSGVPYLRDVPVLGHLFRYTEDQRRRTNLLILITPRVVKDQFDARDLTIEGRNILEQEIELRNIHPDRKEILHRKSINRVAESVPYEGEAPSTILPPEEMSQRNGGSSDIIEFSVETDTKPKFPSAAKQTEKPANVQAAGGFVVLKAQGQSPNLTSLPFAVSEKEGLAAIQLNLAASTPAASKKLAESFSPGSIVGYKMNGETILFKVLGTFPSQQEASSAFGSFSWYELSPYEVMKFGNGPWIKP